MYIFSLTSDIVFYIEKLSCNHFLANPFIIFDTLLPIFPLFLLAHPMFGGFVLPRKNAGFVSALKPIRNPKGGHPETLQNGKPSGVSWRIVRKIKFVMSKVSGHETCNFCNIFLQTLSESNYSSFL